jgi:hypothetical protein
MQARSEHAITLCPEGADVAADTVQSALTSHASNNEDMQMQASKCVPHRAIQQHLQRLNATCGMRGADQGLASMLMADEP